MENEINKKETTKSKTILIILLVAILIIGVTTAIINRNSIGKNDKKTELKHNTNKKVIEDKNIDNITFTDIDCTFDGNNSLLTYKITNKTKNTINLGEYEIIVKDKKGNILANIMPNLDYKLKPNETYETGNAINIDITTANSIEIKLPNKKKV